MTMVKPSQKSAAIAKRSQEERMKRERIDDVLLLLQHLVEREEVTVKMILDCLYDIGSVNLINQKFRARSPNRLMKMVARMTKPVFTIIALRWFKKIVPN